MPQQGQFTAADVDQPQQSATPGAKQQGQFSAADVDGAQPSQGPLAAISGKLGTMWQHAKDAFSGKVDNSTTGGQVQNLVAGNLKNLWDVSAPNVLAQDYKKFTGQPNTLNELPAKVVTTGLPMVLGAPESDFEPGAARTGAPAEAPAPSEGWLSRATEVVKRRISHAPGVQAVKDIDYIVRGPKETPAPTPEPAESPKPSVPDLWGKGRYGTPIDQWGQRIPQSQPGAAGSMAESVQQPIQRGSISQMMKQVQPELEKGLGASPPLKPNVPLRGQLSSLMQNEQPPPSSDLMEGHKPVESQALKSYKYDPDKQEFEAVFQGGGTPVKYSGISPEQAKYFEEAPSKGKAIQAIKNSGTLAEKFINGKWQPVKSQ